MPKPSDGARPRRLPHAQIHLPPLSAGYALTLVQILERALHAIWRAHGREMAQLQACRGEIPTWVVDNAPAERTEP